MHSKLGLAATASAVASLLIGTDAVADRLELHADRFILGNGLRVVVHEDHAAPSVTVAVVYDVGSQNEPPGRAGFAHLFEHLMFNGSEHYNGEWPRPLEVVGGTEINAATSRDSTEYYETIPSAALERTLWMESDRMGHLLGVVDQARLDEQRGVVENEKRQDENQPYGRQLEALYAGLFPIDHPYHQSPIGSIEELDAASVADVRDWFHHYYGPNNAVIVLTGDVTVAEAHRLVERYFGDIPAGPSIDTPTSWTPTRLHDTREIQYDNVASGAISRGWAVPGTTSPDRALLNIAAVVLGEGQSSRLYRTLVEDRRLATQASAVLIDSRLSSVLKLDVTLLSQTSFASADDSIDQTIRDFLRTGPTPEELARAKTLLRARFVRAIENGSYLAISLAAGELDADNPTYIQDYLRAVDAATSEDVMQSARRYLSVGSHEVAVEPRTHYTNTSNGVDRSTGMPAVNNNERTPLNFPHTETAVLANGVRLVVSEQRNVPTVQIAIQFNAGFAADDPAHPGAAGFAAALLTQGTRARSAPQISQETDRLAAYLYATNSPDRTTVSLSALSEQLIPSISVWADSVINSTFADDEIARVREQRLAAFAQDNTDPAAIARAVLTAALYGVHHPYSASFSGLTSEAAIRSVTRDDLLRFRDTWLRPDNATVFVVGDTNMSEIRPLLEQALRSWRKSPAPLQTITTPDAPASRSPRIIIVDRPGAAQSYIFAGLVGPRGANTGDVATSIANDIFGNTFTSRLNMNLREDKHWSYGAYSVLRNGTGPRLLFIQAPVQTDHTGDAIREIQREMTEINSAHPISQEELSAAVLSATRRLPATINNQNGVLTSLTSAALYERPLDYTTRLPELYGALTLAQVQDAARNLFQPDRLVWVIVGDRAAIESQIAGLNMPIELIP
jgi:zinc protease